MKTKTFSDAVYGQRKARELAIKWREEYAKSRGEPQSRAEPPGYWYIKKMMVSNSSMGVRHEYLAYVGFLRIENRRHLSTRWSIEKWGNKIAKQRCEEWVEKKTAELNARLRAAKGSVSKPGAAAKATKRLSLVPPFIKMTKQTCGECGGPIAKMTGPGRRFEYRPHIKGPIPSDFPTNTCATCGEHYLTGSEYETLCNLMVQQESLTPKKKRKKKTVSRRKAA